MNPPHPALPTLSCWSALVPSERLVAEGDPGSGRCPTRPFQTTPWRTLGPGVPPHVGTPNEGTVGPLRLSYPGKWGLNPRLPASRYDLGRTSDVGPGSVSRGPALRPGDGTPSSRPSTPLCFRSLSCATRREAPAVPRAGAGPVSPKVPPVHARSSHAWEIHPTSCVEGKTFGVRKGPPLLVGTSTTLGLQDPGRSRTTPHSSATCSGPGAARSLFDGGNRLSTPAEGSGRRTDRQPGTPGSGDFTSSELTRRARRRSPAPTPPASSGPAVTRAGPGGGRAGDGAGDGAGPR